MDMFVCILLGVCLAFWIEKIGSFVKYEKSTACFPSKCTLALLSFFPWETSTIRILDLLLWSHSPLRCCSCILSVYFPCAAQIIFLIYFQVHWLCSVSFALCYWDHPTSFFFSLFIISSSTVFIFYNFYFLRFSIFHLSYDL